MRRLPTALAAIAAMAIVACSPEHGQTPQPGQRTITILAHNMERTLHGCNDVTGDCTPDRVSLTNWADYKLGAHGGIVIEFRAPDAWNGEPGIPVLLLISRVIAVGGDTVKGDASGQVLVSKHGTAGPWIALNEPYVYINATDAHASFGPVTVPVGRVWVMGDHRNDSADSRFHCGVGGTNGTDGPGCDPMFSTVPVADIVAIATRIVAPPDRVRPL